MTPIVFQYLLRLGDDSLILGHRLAEWCSRAPMLEEDLALTNMALDHIGRTKAIFEYAAAGENLGRSADDIAFGRDERHYHNLLIAELPNGDFAFSMVRMFIFSSFDLLRLQALSNSNDPVLSGIAHKGVKETAYHRRHTADWIQRLGNSTPEAFRRCQSALDALWGYTDEMFLMDETENTLKSLGIGCDLARLRDEWQRDVAEFVASAHFRLPDEAYMHTGGRKGVHTEYLGHILAEMNYGYALMQG